MWWALINFFCLYYGRLFEVGANSRLGAYSNKYGTFKKVLCPIFIWRGTGREFVACLAALRPKKLAPLAKKLVKLDFAVVSMGFSEALSSFSHFSLL